MPRMVSAAIVLGLLGWVTTVDAQTTTDQASDTWNGSVSFNVGGQLSSTTMTDTATFREFVEDGSLRTDYEVNPAIIADAGVAWRIWRRLGVGIAATRFHGRDEATVTFRAPHPFFFDRHRVFEDVVDVERRTVGVHVGAVYMVPAGDRVRIIVAGGPSVFGVSQDLIRDVAFADAFPYDALEDPRALVREEQETVIGFHLAVDVGVRIGSRWGVGGLARFARASVDLTTSGDRTASRTVSTDVGGFQIGGGLRFYF